MALGGAPISGEQEIADEVPAIHFAKWIELDEAACMRSCSRVVASRFLILHHAL